MLKYFATNRHMEQLGKALPKLDHRSRHLLSRGGYYFTDMEQYMEFYLTTTDRESMPPGAVVMDSQNDVFDNFLCDHRVRSIVVCVHGFNTEFDEACTSFRILTDTMKNIPKVGDRILTSPRELREKTVECNSQTAFIGFSWPSDGRLVRYHSDQGDAVGSRDAFASLIARLRASGKPVNLICHSMGNYLACHALAAIIDEYMVPRRAEKILKQLFRGPKFAGSEVVRRDSWLIDSFVMIAPDVERRHVTKCQGFGTESEYVGRFYSGLQHLVRKKVNLYSRQDKVLDISSLEKDGREVVGGLLDKLTLGMLDFRKQNPDQRWEMRLGSAPAPHNAAPGFISINATEIANRAIGHNDHFDSRALAVRIAQELDI